MFFGHIAARINNILRRAQDGKNATHRHVHINVGRTVQRVKNQQVFAAGVGVRDLVRQFHLLRRHSGEVTSPFSGTNEHFVAEHVKFFLHFSLHVDTATIDLTHVSGRIAKLAEGHGMRNRFAGDGNIENQRVKVSTGLRKTPALQDQVLREGLAI